MENDFAPKMNSLREQSGRNSINKYKPKNEIASDDEAAISRREFLKKSILGVAGIVAASQTKPLEHIAKLMEKIRPGTIEQQAAPEIEQTEEEETETEDPEQSASLAEVLSYDQAEKFAFTRGITKQLETYWKNSYREIPRLKKSLSGALQRIHPWESKLENIFKNEGLPVHLAYLSVPESDFILNARSKKNALGPYQFTKETAQKYHLRVCEKNDERNDERTDPIKSGHACAKLLKDLFKVSKDWDISLSAYNGGFAWDYLTAAYKNGEEISYDDFLEHLSNLANDIKSEIKNNKNLLHKIQPRENLGAIAKKYEIDLHTLLANNNLTEKSIIKAGHSLLIPLTDKNRKKVFETKIAGIGQNLSYPARCNAIFEIIKEKKNA
jgi:hypothetical protein